MKNNSRIDRNHELLDEAFSKCSGRARIRLGGDLIGFDDEAHEVFVKSYESPTRYLPAFRFAELMTDHEAKALADVPTWDGSNAYEISKAVLSVVEAVFSRECCVEHVR